MNPIVIKTGLGIISHVVTNIGISALIASISSISRTSQNVYDLIKGFSLSDSEQKVKIRTTLTELDLEATIKVLNEILKKINEKEISSKDILISIQNIKDIILNIESELTLLHNMTDYNESLWLLKKFRAYDCEKSIKTLRLYKSVLDNRRKLLTETLQINYYMNNNNHGNDIIIEKQETSNIKLNETEMTITDNYFTSLL